MPYSFTQIEKDKSRVIGFVFLFLVLIYFLIIWVVGLLIKNYIYFERNEDVYTFSYVFQWLTFKEIAIILCVAAVVGWVHWEHSVNHVIEKILGVLRAEPLNPKDTYHQTLKNIIDEVSVATGGVRIEGVVLPTAALNAFALSDFKGRNVIGITEGMLARLTRAQIEAVVGHEAAHIVSGDCLETTVISSLFELYSGTLKGMEIMVRSASRSNRRAGGIVIVIILVYVLLIFTKTISHFLRMFISRQREYRADAIAVRLTRDPLSLAQALVAIAYHWRGSGLAAEELEAIFITNPKWDAIDEREGFVAELFSTHPPIDKRLRILLDMARADLETVFNDVKRQQVRSKVEAPENIGAERPVQWMAHDGIKWLGPLDLTNLLSLSFLSSDMWVKRMDEENIKMAHQDNLIKGHFNCLAGKKSECLICPRCQVVLQPIFYEGLEIKKCQMCFGSFIRETDVERVIMRKEYTFSDRVKKIAQEIEKDMLYWGQKAIDRSPNTLLRCPKCVNSHLRMNRMFYTAAYHVEVDKCFSCGSFWFDRDELEVLQCLIEEHTKKGNEFIAPRDELKF